MCLYCNLLVQRRIEDGCTIEEIRQLIWKIGNHFQHLKLEGCVVNAVLQIIYSTAENEIGFKKVLLATINEMPLGFPCATCTISYIIRLLPLPTTESILEFAEMLQLSSNRANVDGLVVKIDVNICILLGCLAAKLAGPTSEIIFQRDIMEYLCTFLVNRRHPLLALQALIALEKFAFTANNRSAIQQHFNDQLINSLLTLESFANSKSPEWRQLGFCARWALDNTFPVAGRRPSHEVVEMSHINVILKVDQEHNLLKLSPDGLEVRNDLEDRVGVRATHEVEEGCWYYEVEIITEGLMEFGYATTDVNLLNNNQCLGINEYSVGYDGCRRMIWYHSGGNKMFSLPVWKSGDILGCLLDISEEEIIFSLNGKEMQSFCNIFMLNRFPRKKVLRFYAAASIKSFQQARFNFGSKPFAFPPIDRTFNVFNDNGVLTDEEKKIKPREVLQREVLNAGTDASMDTCLICYTGTPSVALHPCGHSGFCIDCTAKLHQCPLCRVDLDGALPQGPRAE